MGEGNQQQHPGYREEHDLFPSVSGPDITVVDYAKDLLELLAYDSRSDLLKVGGHCEPARCEMAQ